MNHTHTLLLIILLIALGCHAFRPIVEHSNQPQKKAPPLDCPINQKDTIDLDCFFNEFENITSTSCTPKWISMPTEMQHMGDYWKVGQTPKLTKVLLCKKFGVHYHFYPKWFDDGDSCIVYDSHKYPSYLEVCGKYFNMEDLFYGRRPPPAGNGFALMRGSRKKELYAHAQYRIGFDDACVNILYFRSKIYLEIVMSVYLMVGWNNSMTMLFDVTDARNIYGIPITRGYVVFRDFNNDGFLDFVDTFGEGGGEAEAGTNIHTEKALIYTIKDGFIEWSDSRYLMYRTDSTWWCTNNASDVIRSQSNWE